MVTRFFQAAHSHTSAPRSVSIHTKIWRTSWACILAVSCGALAGCQSTRMGSRSDSLASLQSDESDEELETKSSKGGFGSFFTRWWPSDSKDDAYDLGLPRVEEDYVMSDGDADAMERLSDKPSNNKMAQSKSPTNKSPSSKSSMSNPAEKRKNQLAKNAATDSSEAGEGLDAEQRELYRRQMEAMRRLGLNEGELSDILADESSEDGLDEIVQLPPVKKPAAATSIADSSNHNVALGSDGARLKFSDDSTPPAPPTPQNSLPVAAVSTQFPAMQPTAQQPTAQQPTTQQPTVGAQPATNLANQSLPTAPSLAVNSFPNNAATPNVSNVNLPATSYPMPATVGPAPELQPMPLQPANPVQSASTYAGPNDQATIATGPYIENNKQATLPTHWENDVRQAVIKLQERLSQDKNLTAKERTNLEARLRLMQLAANDMDGAMNPSQSWNKDADQWFRSTLFSIHEATALTGPESPNQRFSLVAKHQQEASQHLLSLSDLEINNVSFCTEVQSYGQVVKRPANALTANEEVILYCEFNNFAALKVRDGFETEFEARYEIVDLQNNRIYEEKLPTDRQTSANRRRDYFIAYQMYLPKDIAPGHYRLKLNVKDVKAGKFGQGLVEFQIVK